MPNTSLEELKKEFINEVREDGHNYELAPEEFEAMIENKLEKVWFLSRKGLREEVEKMKKKLNRRMDEEAVGEEAGYNNVLSLLDEEKIANK